MALVLLRLIVCSLCSFIGMATFLVSRIVAMFIVALLQLFKAPSFAFNGILEHARDALKSAGEYVTGLAVDILALAFSTFFELIVSAAMGSLEVASSATVELLGKSKAGLDELAEVLTQVGEGASEMAGNLILGLWSNCMAAVGYIIENV